MQHEMRVIRIVCSKHQFDFSYIVTSITGSSAMDSEESRAFSTSSRTVVYKLFPGCCTQQWNQNKTVLSQACTVWTKQELKLILINCRKKLISMQDTQWFFWAPQGECEELGGKVGALTLSNPAMFLFSAKNSAGDSERKAHHIITQ